MTMLVSYVWNDRIVIMADSRSTLKENQVAISFSDTTLKIYPFLNRGVIATSGLSKIQLNDENYFPISAIIENFISVNKKVLKRSTGKQIISSLVETINNNLITNFNRDPKDLNNRITLLVGIFDYENDLAYPRIYKYQSNFEGIDYTDKIVSGDDEVYPIIQPYFNEDIKSLTFEESIEHFKEGFTEVIKTVETVGGPINIYILQQGRGYWYDRKFF